MGIERGQVDVTTSLDRLRETLDGDRPAVEKYREALAIARRYLGVENAHFKRIPGENGDGARVSVAAGDTTSVDDDTELASSGYCTSCSTDESR